MPKNDLLMCGFIGCASQATKRGLCNSHYERARRAGSLNVTDKQARAMVDKSPKLGSIHDIEDMIPKGKFLELACGRAIKAIRSRASSRMSDWVLARLRLPQGEGVGGDGRVNFEYYPEMPWVFDMLQNPDVRRVDLCYSSQAGKTILLFSCLAYFSGEKKQTGLIAYPTLALTKKVPKTRIIPMLQRTDVGFTGKRDTTLVFDAGNYVQIALMSSPSTMAEMPAQYAIEDERDENVKWDVDPSSLIENRMTTAMNPKHVRASTPKLTNDFGMWACYGKTKRFNLESPCPYCGVHFTSRFPDHFRWPADQDRRNIQLHRLAWLECPNCREKITDVHHRQMVRTMRVKCLDPEIPITEIGLHKRRWETIFKNYSDVVAKFLEVEKDEDKLVDFYNSWCAEPRDILVNVAKPQFATMRGEWSRDKKEIPSWVQAVTAGADVGAGEIWVMLYGWGENNRTACLYSARIEIKTDSSEAVSQALEKLQFVCGMENYTYQGADEFECPQLLIGCIDSGYHTSEIYDLCRASVDLWRPVRGDNGTLKRLFEQREADPEQKHRGKYRGLHFWYHATHQLQDILQKRFWASPGGPGSVEFAIDEGRGQGDEGRLFDHLNAVVREEVTVNGVLKSKWRKISSHSADHLRDALANAELAGRMMGLDALGPQQKKVAVENITTQYREPEQWNQSRQRG